MVRVLVMTALKPRHAQGSCPGLITAHVASSESSNDHCLLDTALSAPYVPATFLTVPSRSRVTPQPIVPFGEIRRLHCRPAVCLRSAAAIRIRHPRRLLLPLSRQAAQCRLED